MTPTNRLIGLFAAMLFATTMLAEVVYEPLIVDSGFNRDVIKAIGSDTAISALYYSGSLSCFGTQSFIAQCNSALESTQPEVYARTVRSGWPDNYRDTIRCNTEWGADALNYSPYDDPKLFWLLAPYTTKNALCLRPTKVGDENLSASNQYKGFQGKGTLKFKKIGCYDRLFFLLVSLRTGTVDPRTVQTTVYYTDGTTTSTTFTLTGGLSGEARHKARMTNIYETTFNKNKVEGKEAAYAEVFDIVVDHTKLIDHISFSNPITNSSVTILAVTGRTADIAAPDEESTEVEDIQNHQFTISWDGVPEAETYRVDVATDEDFQNMVEGYNNKEVSKTDTVVTGLDEDEDYYWRVRSVNADGGQSASSSPRRARTAGGTIPEANDENEGIEGTLAPYLNTAYASFKIDRTLWRDGYYNTLCLPFNLSASEIADSPLAGAMVFEYVGAEQIGDNQLDIEVSETSDIVAGKPYLIRWPNMGDVINPPLTFHNVTIRTNVGQAVGDPEGVQFIGNIAIDTLVGGDSHNLFLGANNTLYWPNENQNRMRGFRAHFQVYAGGPAPIRRGTPSRIVEQKEIATDVVTVNGERLAVSGKMLINGQIVIIRDGKRYNVLGVEL